ncbi:hypothetical protein LOK49_LG08G02559 [Camellia lanceoleosa]|uniref:Uncharacterized protein n=1 Tax=Camellia lanceoleosa TaxID=1840588 RepID=A0ACC0GVU8_9ERIC|nr:hypothetical protein LOK49_LG08G02559 [Camellia lanceoleosa]
MPVVKKSEASDQMIQQKIYDIFSKISSESEQHVADEDGTDGDVIVIDIDHGRSYDYVPERVRIGLNHGMLWYDTMYEHKCSYLNSLAVGTNGETSLEVYVRAMEEIVEDILTCYEHPTYAELRYFVEIMLLDSCFIIELFHNHNKMRMNGLTPYNNRNIKDSLQRYLIGIGNQLPFYVLDKFFKTAQNQGKYRGEKLGDLTQNFFRNMVGPYGGITSCDNIQHLLELVYQTFFDPKSWCSPNVTKVRELEFIDYASELQEVGVKFNNIEGEKKLRENRTSLGKSFKRVNYKSRVFGFHTKHCIYFET